VAKEIANKDPVGPEPKIFIFFLFTMKNL